MERKILLTTTVPKFRVIFMMVGVASVLYSKKFHLDVPDG